jgi:hypothetical protein
MQQISDINSELLQILTNFSDWFFSQDLEKEGLHPEEKNEKGKDAGLYAASEEYLRKILWNPIEKHGFPEYMYGAVMENNISRRELQPKLFRSKCDELDRELIMYFGAKNNALRAYYPKDGYIGWHHNGNAPGNNIILTFNPEGDGEFLHYDHINDVVRCHKDLKGKWFAKVGYFGDCYKEPDKVYWHAARTQSPRITLSYIVPNLKVWQSMVDDIGTPDKDI